MSTGFLNGSTNPPVFFEFLSISLKCSHPIFFFTVRDAWTGRPAASMYYSTHWVSSSSTNPGSPRIPITRAFSTFSPSAMPV